MFIKFFCTKGSSTSLWSQIFRSCILASNSLETGCNAKDIKWLPAAYSEVGGLHRLNSFCNTSKPYSINLSIKGEFKENTFARFWSIYFISDLKEKCSKQIKGKCHFHCARKVSAGKKQAYWRVEDKNKTIHLFCVFIACVIIQAGTYQLVYFITIFRDTASIKK